MLGKLIKYDLKYAMKIFLMMHGIYLLLCLVLRLLILDKIDFEGPAESFIMPVTLVGILMVFVLTAVTLTTSLLIALRFYRNMFSREGYLSWTLPASSTQHLAAKFLSGYLLAAVNIVVIALGILLLLTGSNVTEAYGKIAEDLETYLGTTLGAYALKLFLFTVIFTFTSVIQIYFSIVLGQLFPDHRVLLAIAFYFLTGVVVQIITSVLVLATGFYGNMFTDNGAYFQLGQYSDGLYLMTGILSSVLAVIEYIAAHYIMKRKINLI